MNCQISEAYIMQALDGELHDLEKAKLQKHLKECEACSRLYADMNTIFDDIQSLPEIEPPTGFEISILSRINAEEERRLEKLNATMMTIYGLLFGGIIGLCIYFYGALREKTAEDFWKMTVNGIVHTISNLSGLYENLNSFQMWSVNSWLSGMMNVLAFSIAVMVVTALTLAGMTAMRRHEAE